VETTPPLSRAQILQSIKDFLDESSPATLRQCRHCGAAMRFIDSNFLLRGTTLNWNVSLPFCANCDRELLENLPHPETIH